MSRLPIRLRLTLAYAVVMALVFAAVGAILHARLASTLDERIADTLEERTTALASTLDVTSPAAAGEEGLAQLLEADGSVVAGSSAAAERSLLSDSTLAPAQLGRKTVDVAVSGESYRLLATPVDDRIVVVGESLEDRDEALDGLLAQLVVVLPIAVLVSSVLGYLVAGAAFRPVEAMRRRAAEISTDTRQRRLPLPAAEDEIHRLGETLNAMLGRLDEGIERERRFVADASHELRTPLAALRAELELAARRPRTREQLEDALASAGEEVERLVRLSEDLLVLARADEGQLPLRVETHSAREVLKAVAARNTRRFSADDRAVDVSAPDGLALRGDRARLEQALDALVDNAYRHGDGPVLMTAREENGVVVLAVRDEGRGFPPELLPRALERFSRADPARGGPGTGLGLAIVDAIAHAHGGSAEVANVGTTGAMARLVLPSRLNAGNAARGDSRGVA